MHFPGRMVFGEIERREVEIVGLDIRSFGKGKTHIRIDRGQFVHHLADRVDAALGRVRLGQGQGDIDPLGGEPRFEGLGLQFGAAGLDGRADLGFQAIERRAHHLALVRGHLAKGRQKGGDRSFLAERRNADRIERCGVFGGGDFFKKV